VAIIQRGVALFGNQENASPMHKTLGILLSLSLSHCLSTTIHAYMYIEFVRDCFDISPEEPDRFKEQLFKYDQVLLLNQRDETTLVKVTLTTRFFDQVLGTLNRLVTLHAVFKL
jgi:hypothetical protein